MNEPMSQDVQRYECKPGIYDCKLQAFRPIMAPNDEGDWVLHTDYAALRAALAAAEARVKDLEEVLATQGRNAAQAAKDYVVKLAQVEKERDKAIEVCNIIANGLAGEKIPQLERQLAERDATIAELREWQRIVMGSGTDQETVIRMAAAEYTKTAVQCWKERVAEVEQREQRLREAVEFYADQGTWIAVGLLAESPCGAIMSDFSETDDLGEKPGKRAREVLEAVAKPSPSPQGGDAPTRER